MKSELSLIRKRQNRDILQEAFRIATRHKFFERSFEQGPKIQGTCLIFMAPELWHYHGRV